MLGQGIAGAGFFLPADDVLVATPMVPKTEGVQYV